MRTIIIYYRKAYIMGNKNIYSSSIIKTGIAPQIGTDNTAFVSAIIDTQSWNYLEFEIFTGTIADSDVTATVLVEGGNNSALSDNTAIADSQLQGTESGAGFQFDDDNEVRKIGVKNLQYRYYRITITPSNNTGNLPICVGARLSGTNYIGATQPES